MHVGYQYNQYKGLLQPVRFLGQSDKLCMCDVNIALFFTGHQHPYYVRLTMDMTLSIKIKDGARHVIQGYFLKTGNIFPTRRNTHENKPLKLAKTEKIL